MRYTIYTDGAYSAPKKIAGCSYLILTDMEYVTMESKGILAVVNSTQAETVSIGLAAAYLIDKIELNEDDEVVFNTDCASAIEFYRDYINNSGRVKSNIKEVINSVFIVRYLNKKCKVSFAKVKGHKNFMNPNTYVDRLAKIAIRRE